MRVLHVIPAVAAQYGGPSQAVIGMCHALRAAGIETVIATTDADGTSRLPVETGAIIPYRDVPTIFFRRQATESFKWSAPLATWLNANVQQFDVVHVHAVFSHSSIAAGRACRATGVPYIVRPLGTLDPWSLDQHPRRKQLLLAFGGRRFLAGARAMHYTTAEEQQLAEQRLPWLPAGHVVPLGIDHGFFPTATVGCQRMPLVIAMCRLDPKKGLDLLIEAFHRAIDSAPLTSWQLVIVGDGDAEYVRKLKLLAQNGPARAQIEFRGWLAGEERHELLRSASLFAMPSKQENFGLALVEAMASGLPVVVTRGVNLANDIAAAGAGWIADSHLVRLAETLRTAMTSGQLLEDRGRNAREFAGRFTWSSVAEALQSLYQHAVVGAVASTRSRLPLAIRS